MRRLVRYRILREGDRAVLSRTAGQTEETGFCRADEVLHLLRRCRVQRWDGFHGRPFPGLKDGTMFSFTARLNGRTIHASGHQHFPPRFHQFKEGIEQLSGEVL